VNSSSLPFLSFTLFRFLESLFFHFPSTLLFFSMLLFPIFRFPLFLFLPPLTINISIVSLLVEGDHFYSALPFSYPWCLGVFFFLFLPTHETLLFVLFHPPLGPCPKKDVFTRRFHRSLFFSSLPLRFPPTTPFPCFFDFLFALPVFLLSRTRFHLFPLRFFPIRCFGNCPPCLFSLVHFSFPSDHPLSE